MISLKILFFFQEVNIVQVFKNHELLSLAGVAQWIECQDTNQRVTTSSIPGLGHMPGLQTRSPVGGMQEAAIH